MNIGAQMMHLWRKDWLRTRWMFLLLSTTMAASVALSHPAERVPMCETIQGCENPFLWLMQLLTALVTMVFVASIIQLDSPTDDASFWVTHPISTKALLCEKLVYALGAVLTLVIVAQTASLFLNGLRILPSLPSLGMTVYWVASFVFVSVLLSATGRGTQVFVFLAIGFVLLRLIASSGWLNFLPGTAFSVSRVASGIRADVWMALAFALCAWLYLARRVRKTNRQLSAWFSLAILTLGWDSGLESGVRFFAAGTEPPNANPPAIEYAVTRTDSNFFVRISMQAPSPGRRYALACPSWAVRFPDGRTSTPALYESCNKWQPVTATPLERDHSDPGSDSVSTIIRVPIAGIEFERDLLRGDALVIDGYIDEQSTGVPIIIPVENGATAAHGSRSFTVSYNEAVIGEHNYQRLEIQIENAHQRITHIPKSVGKSARLNSVENVYIGLEQLTENGYEFRTISRSGRDTVAMSIDSDQHSNGRGTPPKWSNVSLALPGPGVAHFRAHLIPKCVLVCGESLSHNSRLLITAWQHVQYAPFHAEIPLPPR